MRYISCKAFSHKKGVMMMLNPFLVVSVCLFFLLHSRNIGVLCQILGTRSTYFLDVHTYPSFYICSLFT